jgi:hypothetical protein
MSSFKPGTLLVVYFLMALHGCPGLDYLGPRDFVSEKSQQELRRQMPELGAQAAIAIATFNRKARLPIVRKTEWVQKPFRLAQTWNLYRDGPGRRNYLEIRIDDVLVHRTADSEFNWLTPQLRSRRIRPMVESTARTKNSKNWKGLTRFIVNRALHEFPEAKKVVVQSVQRPFRKGESQNRHAIVATAPEWKPVLK